jgi:hypothetical protein
VTDNGTPVAGATVMINNSMTGAATTVVTDASGAAAFLLSVGATQAPASYAVTFQAALAGYTSSAVMSRSVVVTTATPPSGAFSIDVRFTATATAAQQQAFADAAAHWSRVIVGDVPNANVTAADGVTANVCGITHPAVVENIDDLLIFVELTDLDGPGGLLGQAGPCMIRNSALPIIGTMQFDVADLANMEANGTLGQVIMHEMGHVLGFGTIWDYVSVPLLNGAGGTDPFFAGAQAKNRYGLLGAVLENGVPVENCLVGVPAGCGAGTRDAHWREFTFGSELMTGYIGGGSNPLSAVTIGSLADIGYTVDMTAADTYALPTPGGAGVHADSEQGVRLNERLVHPILRKK